MVVDSCCAVASLLIAEVFEARGTTSMNTSIYNVRSITVNALPDEATSLLIHVYHRCSLTSHLLDPCKVRQNRGKKREIKAAAYSRWLLTKIYSQNRQILRCKIQHFGAILRKYRSTIGRVEFLCNFGQIFRSLTSL